MNDLVVTPSRLRWLRGGANVDRLGWIVTVYLLPLAIAAVSLVALLVWPNVYSAAPLKHLNVQAVMQPLDAMTPRIAGEILVRQPPVQYFDTRLSEDPVWFYVPISIHSEEPLVVEFPSRHAINLACWDGNSYAPLGNAVRNRADGSIDLVKAGFAVKLNANTHSLVCRTAFVGPARLNANLWTSEQIEISTQDYHRRSGYIDGGLMILALFVLVTALINREGVFVLFAAWLLVIMRLSATSGGWDDQWLNHAVPPEWLSHGRSLTRAAWALLTVTLFRTLLADELVGTRSAKLVRLAQWLCLFLFPAAMIFPRVIFVATLWMVGGLALSLLIFSIISIIFRTRSRVAIWYAASLGVTFIFSLLEIWSAAVGNDGISSNSNSVVAALTSGLLASLAIAEQMRQEHLQRLAAQEQLQQTFNSVPIGLFSLDERGHFLSANTAMLHMLGDRADQVLAAPWAAYFSSQWWQKLYELVQNETKGELEIANFFIPNQREQRSYLVKATLSKGTIEGSLQDVTEKVAATEHLHFLADNDSLTRSLNRRGIETALRLAMEQLAAGRPLALAYLDLDRFKLINDLYGRNAGDEVLQHVCTRTQNVMSDGMSLGRLGGDEFLVVMPNTTIEQAKVACSRIIATVSNRPYDVADKALHVRGSIGLVAVESGTSVKDAISTADRACRAAKSGGGSEGMVIYNKDSKAFADYEAEISLVELLSGGDATQGLYLVMQPIMSLGAPHGSLNFEVLLRMNGTDGKPVRTDHLIRAAESSGRMSMIDRWVLTTTLEWLNANYAQLQHTKFICMNLNGASLNDERFLDYVVGMLEQNKALAHQLCYEITESVALHDLENTQRFISKVRSFGAKVALDDFGAGYTSFSYLKELSADMVKIDGSFIVNMNQHPANIAIVEAIVNLANNLGLKTIAEWAEDVATVQTLKDIGVDYVQGYVVARPQDPTKLVGASSSASFIADEALHRMVTGFTNAAPAVVQIDLFDPTPKPH